MTEIRFHAPEKLSPTAVDILKAAKHEVFGDEPVTFTPSTPGSGVLCLGVDAKGGIRTLSPAQIITSANSVSSLAEALMLYRDGNTLPPPNIVHVSPGMEWVYIEKMEQRFDYPVVFDIENAPDRSLLSIAVTYGGNQAVFTDQFKGVVEALAQHYYVIAHGGKHDQGVIRDIYGIKVPVWFDTMIARHALHPASQGRLGLKQLAEWVLGIPDWETDIKEYTGTGENADYSKIPHDLLVQYNGTDVYATWHLAARFLPQVLDDRNFWYEMTATYDMLADVEYNRVKIDVGYTQAYADELENDAQVHLATLREITGDNKFNPNSWQQVLKALDAMGYNPPNTAADTLNRMLEDGEAAELIEPLLNYRKLTKLRSTYCLSLLNKQVDGFVRAEFNVEGTSSGRLSGRKPNLQNIPRDDRTRGMFVAHAPEDVIVGVDYAQAELRAQAVLSGDPDMIAAFQPDSPDFFDGLMPNAFPHEFPTLDDYLAYEQDKCGGDEKDYRAKLKATIYGLGFGRGAAAIGTSLKMPESDAQAIIDAFFQTYPVWAQWREDVMQAAVDMSKRDMLTAWTGHRFEAEVITGRNRSAVQRSALSYLPQATVGGLCTTAGINVNRRLKAEYPEAKLIMLIHDALYVNCPRLLAQEVGNMVASEMTEVGREVFGDTVLFTAEAGYSYRWGEHE